MDGPFIEAKELIGGWALMEARDKDEAVEWTKRFLRWPVTASPIRQVDRPLSRQCPPRGSGGAAGNGAPGGAMPRGHGATRRLAWPDGG